MIDIQDKKNCCGCSACAQICPKQCVDMVRDHEGFLYPCVNVDLCIECGLCEKVCPEITVDDAREPLEVYAAICKDEELRAKSSSGGAFTLIAEDVLKSGGVVYGAIFDENWDVKHDYVTNADELWKMRGSKYVQSDISGSYNNVRQHLKQGIRVLFTGTPCQVAGLRRYLAKDYNNLLCVDFVCHGVPSPMVWSRYLSETLAQRGFSRRNIIGITFRSKRISWRKYSLVINLTKNGSEHVMSSALDESSYFKGFMKNLYLRPSCYFCSQRNFRSGSDITIADYWGVEKVFPQLSDNKGVSLVMINSDIGKRLYLRLDLNNYQSDISTVINLNRSIVRSVALPQLRSPFFKEINSRKNLLPVLNKYTRTKILDLVKRYGKAILRRVRSRKNQY